MSAEKAELRRTARAVRSGMPQKVRDAASAAICERLLALPLFAACRTLLCYAPFAGEVDILPVAEAALGQGKTVGFPICHGETMAFYAVSSLAELCQTDAFGIRIPSEDASRRITPDGDTLLLLPGLAFDGAGNRIGYGKGYYDRYLRGAQSMPVTLGVTYASCVVAQIPKEPQDIPVACLVTEDEWIACSQTGKK